MRGADSCSRRELLGAASGALVAAFAPIVRAESNAAQGAVRLVAAGDIGFSKDLNHAIEDEGVDPFAELGGAFSDADLAFANLESPLASADVKGRTFRKGAPILRGTPKAAPALAKAGLDVVSLANNHVFDLGRAGLEQTLSHVRGAGVETLGAGLSHDEAFRPFRRTLGGLRIGALAFTYGTNHPAEGGAVAARLRDDPAGEVARLRPDVDRLFVSLHWGEQFRHAVSQDQIGLAHKLIEAGADAIVGHHPHVLQGVEKYRGRPIVYSLGNFLWGLQTQTMTSALAVIEFTPGTGDVGLKIVPVLRRPPLGLPRVVGLEEGRNVVGLIRVHSRRFRTKFRATDGALTLVP